MKKLIDYIKEGYSGYEWVESDSCADLLANIFTEFNKLIIEKINKYIDSQKDNINKGLSQFDSANAILFIFDMYANNKREYDIKEDLADLCIDCITNVQENEECIQTWDDPEEFRDHLDKMMEKAVQYKNISEK